MRIASRYFATVRRAMSTPSRCSSSTIRSSDSVSSAGSPSIRPRMRKRTASAECASPPPEAGIAEVKKIFQLEQAARRRDVFVAGDAADRALVHPDRVGDVAQDQRPQRLHALAKEAVLLAHDLGRDLEDRRGALVQRFDQPVRRLEPLGQIFPLGLAADAAADPGVIAVVDQNPRQRLGVQLDDPAALAAARASGCRE